MPCKKLELRFKENHENLAALLNKLKKKLPKKDIAAISALADSLDSDYQNMLARNAETLNEVKATKKRLLQSEKMSAIGQLAAGVAHEINNPVGFVSSNLNTLAQYVQNLLKLLDAFDSKNSKPDSEIQKLKKSMDYEFLREDVLDLLKESTDGLNRVKKIVQDMKVFSHVDQGQWQMENVNAVLESTINLVWHEIKYKAKLIRNFDAHLPSIVCLPAQLSQVFMNILVNATQAVSSENGEIRITTRTKDSKTVEVIIADNGRGMALDIQPHVFEPFFTTKPAGKGTGLGMSLSYEIIQHHNGDIRFESTPNHGTTFTITLPDNLNKLNNTSEENTE